MGLFQPQKKFFFGQNYAITLLTPENLKIQFSTFSGFLGPKLKKGISEKLICFSNGIELLKNF